MKPTAKQAVTELAEIAADMTRRWYEDEESLFWEYGCSDEQYMETKAERDRLLKRVAYLREIAGED